MAVAVKFDFDALRLSVGCFVWSVFCLRFADGKRAEFQSFVGISNLRISNLVFAILLLENFDSQLCVLTKN